MKIRLLFQILALFVGLLPLGVHSQRISNILPNGLSYDNTYVDYSKGESLALFNVLSTDCDECLNGPCYFLLEVEGNYADKRESCLWLTDGQDTDLFEDSCQDRFNITMSQVWNISEALKLQGRPVMIGAASCSRSNGTVKNFWTGSGDDLPDWIEVESGPGPRECRFLAVNTGSLSTTLLLVNDNETDLVLCGHKINSTCSGGGNGSEVTSTTVEPTTTTTETDNTTVRCNRTVYEGYTFGNVKPGTTIYHNCRNGYGGYVYWDCIQRKGEDPIFSPETPTFDCIPKWLQELQDKFDKLAPLEFATTMSNSTKHNVLEYDYNIYVVMDLLDKVRKKFFDVVVKEQVAGFMDLAVDVASNILDSKNSEVWSTMRSRAKMMGRFGKVLNVVEALGLDFARCSSEHVGSSFDKTNVDLENVAAKEQEPSVFIRDDNQIVLSPTNATFGFTSAGVFYRWFEHIWGNVTMNSDPEMASEVPEEGDQVLNSPIIALSLNSTKKPIEHLQVKVILRKYTTTNRTDPVCVFWDSVSSNWSNSGCSLDERETNETHVVCQCNHLTNFAVLMTINKDAPKNFALEIVSIICCSASMLGLIFTIACLAGIRSLRCRRNTITCNLSLALLMVNFFVLFGLQRTENMIVCRVMAMFLHYFLLSSFAWMLLEGYFLYQMVIVVFSKISLIPMSLFYAAGYGLPLVIVAVSSASRFGHYTQKNYCWLSARHGLIWSFIGPLCVLVLINTFVFGITFRTALKARRQKDKSTSYQMSWLRGSFSTMCLLGVTWIVAFTYFDNKLIFTTYIFSILNGSQGLFIFIANVLINDRNRSIVLRVLRGQKDIQRTRSQGASSTKTQLSSQSSLQSSGQLSIPRPSVTTDNL